MSYWFIIIFLAEASLVFVGWCIGGLLINLIYRKPFTWWEWKKDAEIGILYSLVYALILNFILWL